MLSDGFKRIVLSSIDDHIITWDFALKKLVSTNTVEICELRF